jgi:hypothetical protein
MTTMLKCKREEAGLAAARPTLYLITLSGKGLRDVGDEIVGIFDPDRHANQGGSNSNFTTNFLGDALSLSDGN